MKAKNLLRSILSLAMVFCMSIPVFAEYSTSVVYDADAESGVTENWELTVPAEMAPGATAQVTATGNWASNRKLTVSSPASVAMTNSLGSGNKTLAITFDGIDQVGSNTEDMSISEDITVANITNALFGTWSGTFDYTVAMSDVDAT